MEDENAVTPTLCFAQVSLDRCSNDAWSDSNWPEKIQMRVIKLLSVNSIHRYKWKSKRKPATYLRCMHNNNLKMKTAGYSCGPQIKVVNNSPLHVVEGLCKCLMFYFCVSLAEQLNSQKVNQSVKMKHLVFPRVKNGILSLTNERAKRPAIPVRHAEFPWVAWPFVSSVCSLVCSIRRCLKNINEVFWWVRGCMYNIVML